MSRAQGVSDEQLRDLAIYRRSPAYSDDERLVLDLAVEMAKAPVSVPDELMADLRRRFDEAQLVELVAAIAWENYRARFNRPFGVEAFGFSTGAVCAVPDHAPAPPP